MRSSDPVRGFVMLIAAVLALWRGWHIHHGRVAWIAYGLAALALAMGVWHLIRKEPGPRKWLHSISRRCQSMAPLFSSRQAVPAEPNVM